MKRENPGSNIGSIFDFEGDAPTEETINQYSKIDILTDLKDGDSYC